MPDLRLTGCRPVPLAHYLKALGVLRLVAEQADPQARGAWRGDAFVLSSTLDEDALLAFFLERYQPTPIIAPWNGGSGFYPKDNRAALETIAGSNAPRWAEYRRTIALGQQVLSSLNLAAKVDKADKPRLLASLRNQLPDAALDWLDAALLLTTGSPKYPPLLGTGGNDGRLDFTNNLMQRLVELLPPDQEPPPATGMLLRHALFGVPVDRLTTKAIGQFLPGDAGGANAEAGFDAASLIDPWDFVLMLEGAVMFAAVAARRLEHTTPGVLAYPFTVHAVGAGYGSATARDAADSRAEMWLPTWSTPTGLAELRALLGEGRAQVGKRSRPPRDGVDFARAVTSLGVDRGLDAFERYGFHVRNGLSYFAIPLGRFEVGTAPDPLWAIDPWFDGFRRIASHDQAPARVRRALHRLERAVVEVCRYGRAEQSGPRMTEVLLALGGCERAMAESLAWSIDSHARPIPRLDPERWLSFLQPSAELRLAAAFTSLRARQLQREPGSTTVAPAGQVLPPMREHIEPVEGPPRRLHWRKTADRDVVGVGPVPERSLLQILQRRVMLSQRHGIGSHREKAAVMAAMSDVATFIDGATDDARLAEHVWACTLLDWERSSPSTAQQLRCEAPLEPCPGPAYALLKLCFAGCAVPRASASDPSASPVDVSTEPSILRLLEAGRGHHALEAARRRLRASDLVTRLAPFDLPPTMARRLGAALCFPLHQADLRHLARSVLPFEQVQAPRPQETSA